MLRANMRQVTNCADNLVLLGEMLELASGYVDHCEEILDQEEAFMALLAREQIHFLRKRVAKLDERLRALEIELRPKAAKDNGIKIRVK
jgi:hypothetical protein